ncbi:MAG: glycosyltransferase family 2 protein [Planctomycetes bacterium]|nr:glycosyltransferase family 2 protein [Planctomycetota bacterium]
MAETSDIHLSVVVPFFNEEANVRPLYEQLTATLQPLGKSYELVFVDDGSTDGTFAALRAIQAADDRVVVIRFRRNFGQTPALAAGFDHARGQIIISMDGDLQHDPSEIPQFLQGIEEGYDIVSGWRKERVDAFWTRRLPSRVANRIIAALSGVKLHDFGTTYKAYRREVIKQVELFGELHRYIPALASAVGARIKEIPIKNVPRQQGKSKYNLTRVFNVLFDLMLVKFLISYLSRPLKVFGVLGLLSFGGGFLISAALMAWWCACAPSGYNLARERGGLLLLSALLMLAGVQFVTMGITAEIAARTYHRTAQKPIYVIQEVLRA